ncbi:MAG: histidine phosphatase family protein [Eubacteriales bacterium]
MTNLIVVRHAQSIANMNGIFIGHMDLDLSELGKKQAELTAEYLIRENIPIDKIYSSDLLRPYHTVEPYAIKKGMEIIKRKELREIYAGKWEGKKFDELPELYFKTYGVWLTDISKAECDGGETVANLYERINKEIDRIASENDGKTVLIATHATPLRCMIARAKGVGLDGMQNVSWGGNASLNYFTYKDGTLVPEKLGQCDHLGLLHSELPKNV